MKLIFISALLIVSQLTFAQTMNEADMQKMMERMNKAQACFEKIDPDAFKEIETKGRAMEQNIKGLCQAGKRGQAMTKAIQFSKEFYASESYQEVAKCTKLMDGMIQQIPIPDLVEDFDDTDTHVCDSM